MNQEFVTTLVLYTAFGAIIGWYIWLIGSGICALAKWIKKKVRERKEKKEE